MKKTTTTATATTTKDVYKRKCFEYVVRVVYVVYVISS